MHITYEDVVAETITTDTHLIAWLAALGELVATPMDATTRAQLVESVHDLRDAYRDSIARRQELVG